VKMKFVKCHFFSGDPTPESEIANKLERGTLSVI
jgi:hypothetical protein